MAAAKKADPKAQKKGAKPQKDAGAAKKKAPKKWVKTAEKEKVHREVVVTKAVYEKIKKEAIGSNLITPGALASKNNLTVSLAKKLLQSFVDEGFLEVLTKSSFGTAYGKKKAAELKEVEATEADKMEVESAA